MTIKWLNNVWIFIIRLSILISVSGNRSAVDAGGSDQRPSHIEMTEPVVRLVRTDLEDLEQFVGSLVEHGLQVGTQGTVLSEYGFPVQATLRIIPEMEGESLLVFLEDEEAASAEAALVDPLGSPIGTTMASSKSTPHFYQQGALIVLYVGNVLETISAVDVAIGLQFAGS